MNNPSQSVNPCVPDASICEACGAAFGCGARSSSGCWCAEVKLGETVRAELRTRYERCLCRTCLESYAAPERGTVEKDNG